MEGFNPPVFLYKITWILLIILLILIIYYLINIGNNFVSENKKIKLKDKRILLIFISIAVIYMFFLLLNRYSILSDTFFTIILSAILAYLFNPVINYLEQKNVKRVIGVILLYLGILCFVLIFALLVIPRSSSEIRGLMNNMPIYIERISKIIDEIYNKYYSTIGELPPLFQGVQQVVMENIVGFEHLIMDGLKSFVGGILKTFSKFVSLVLTPILTFYFLVDKDYFKEKIMSFIPEKNRDQLINLFHEIDKSMSLYVRGKIIMAVYVGVATAIILLILRVDFALLIGFITGVADIIPYIGPFLGFFPAAFFAYLNSPIKAIWVSLIFVLIQWVENNILAPKIIGDSTGLHPLIVLISIIIGGGIFGVLGMILAVPVVAMSIILFRFITQKLNIAWKPRK